MLDADEARISVRDHGLTVGDGVFETMKVVDGVPFALSRHLARLAQSVERLALTAPAQDGCATRPPSCSRRTSRARSGGCASRSPAASDRPAPSAARSGPTVLMVTGPARH